MPRWLAELVGEGAPQPHPCLQLRGLAQGRRSSMVGGKEQAETEVAQKSIALNLLWPQGD